MNRILISAGLLVAGAAIAVAHSAGTPDRGNMSTAASSATAEAGKADAVKELAPTGKLRAAINLGNPVLAQGDAKGPRGVTVDLATELAKRLGVPLELVPFDGAGKVFEALKSNAWDIAFLAIEPVRAAEIAFTSPYVLIEGVYMVPKNSPLKSVEEVDRAGVRIGVNKGSAYDLFLSRTLKNAQLVRSENGVESFRKEKLDAAAGVKQPLVAYARAHDDVQIMPGRFMEIRQAMGTPQGRPAAARYLQAFIEEMKASGFVAEGLKRSNQPDAAVAPPA
jgi:polar amino acid transport system substrate-binding protein